MRRVENINPSVQFNCLSGDDFRLRIQSLVIESAFHRENLTLFPRYDEMECWMTAQGDSGFAISPDHELVNVFSVVKGNGREAVALATSLRPFLHLNCYEGPLEVLYAQHGFVTQRREANWTAGKPDIVFMRYNGLGLA